MIRKDFNIVSLVGSAVLAIVFALGSYFGNDVVCKLVSNAHNTVAPAFEEYYSGLENKINEEYFGIGMSADELVKYDKEHKKLKTEAADAEKSETKAPDSAQKKSQSSPQKKSAKKEVTANDKRKLGGNWNFTGRTWIWHSGIVSIIREPMIAIKGLQEKQIAPTFNNVMAGLYPKFRAQINMHNAFMEVLMVSGLIGFALVILWTVLLVAKMVKLFFGEGVGAEVKLLTLPIAALFIVSLAEVLLFGWLDISSMVFCLCVGVFLGAYHDIYPVKK